MVSSKDKVLYDITEKIWIKQVNTKALQNTMIVNRVHINSAAV